MQPHVSHTPATIPAMNPMITPRTGVSHTPAMIAPPAMIITVMIVAHNDRDAIP